MDAGRLALLLPEIYQRAAGPGTPLAAVLDVMADQHAPVEDVIEGFPGMLDPWRAPDPFIPYLAGWVGLDGWLTRDGDFEAGIDTLRAVVAAAPELRRHRGTTEGLSLALSLALDGAPVRVDDGTTEMTDPFVVKVTLPPGTEPVLGMVRRIVREEKAAHCVVEIAVEAGVDPGNGARETDASPEEP